MRQTVKILVERTGELRPGLDGGAIYSLSGLYDVDKLKEQAVSIELYVNGEKWGELPLGLPVDKKGA